MYNYYFDEAYKSQKITINNKGQINFLNKKLNQRGVFVAFVGWNEQDEKSIYQKYHMLEDAIGITKELKGEYFTRKHGFVRGVASLTKKKADDFYNFLRFVDNNVEDIFISFISKYELLANTLFSNFLEYSITYFNLLIQKDFITYLNSMITEILPYKQDEMKKESPYEQEREIRYSFAKYLDQNTTKEFWEQIRTNIIQLGTNEEINNLLLEELKKSIRLNEKYLENLKGNYDHQSCIRKRELKGEIKFFQGLIILVSLFVKTSGTKSKWCKQYIKNGKLVIPFDYTPYFYCFFQQNIGKKIVLMTDPEGTNEEVKEATKAANNFNNIIVKRAKTNEKNISETITGLRIADMLSHLYGALSLYLRNSWDNNRFESKYVKRFNIKLFKINKYTFDIYKLWDKLSCKIKIVPVSDYYDDLQIALAFLKYINKYNDFEDYNNFSAKEHENLFSHVLHNELKRQFGE